MMAPLSKQERLHFAHVLYELMSPIHKEVLKARLENGEDLFPRAVALMTPDLKFRSVTAADIDALPWDEESKTVKRCQWCAAFEAGSSKMQSCTANGKTVWYCNASCQRKQTKWNVELEQKKQQGCKSQQGAVLGLPHTNRHLV